MAVRTELTAGTHLASYAIESVLGRGGMSVVYAASDSRLGRRVALKVLAPPIADSERFRRRFLGESRLAASIDHPNVIPVYEAGDADGVLYIAMRLVSGSDLRSLLAQEVSLEPVRALAIVSQAARALDAAHAHGLLHRDVKPGNILLTSGEGGLEHVYLSDFGLAVPGDIEGALEGGRFHGTAEYAAPEQIEGRSEARSDVYSLACVLFECIAGEPPFGRRRLLELLWCHLNDEPPRLSERCPEYAAADDVFAGALAKDPADRPATCGEFVENVRTALGLDRPRSFLERPAIVLAAGVLLAVVAGSALAFGFGRGNPGAPVHGGISTFAGSGSRGSAGDGGSALAAELNEPGSLAIDLDGNVYVSEYTGYRVRRVDRRGEISTVFGAGKEGLSGDGGPATSATTATVDLQFDPAGRLYVLDSHHPALRRVDEGGTITTVAGTGRVGILADGPQTRSPDLCSSPRGPAFDRRGTAYVVCPTAHRVIRIERDGVFTTVAGSGDAGYSGDGGPATAAQLNLPVGVAVDRAGNLYIADALNHRVRKVDTSGVITTIAGTGRPGLSGDGWRATAVDLWSPTVVEADAAGNVYVVEAATHRVRKIGPDGVITTVAGTGTPGFSGDGGSGAEAELRDPADVAVDAQGNIYIADRNNNRIRRIRP